MRNIALVFFACTQGVFAAPPEPQPYTTPVPPGLPIDAGIYVLIIVGLLFSFFKFKSHLQHKKTPM